MTVYFVQSRTTALIKIGITGNFSARLAMLHRAGGGEVTTLLLLDGGRAEERDLHLRFASDRVRGEWFTPSAALLEFINRPPTVKPRTPGSPQWLVKVGEMIGGSSWHAEAAQFLGVTARTIRRWTAGKSPIPDDMTDRMATLCRAKAAKLTATAVELRKGTKR